jgi:anthranilate phosphoribosyltransferase
LSEGWKKFAPYLKILARGPESLTDLEPEVAEEAAELILRGVASPAQAGSFFLIGRAKGNSATELAAISRAMRKFCRHIAALHDPPVVTVSGGFDGKTRTFNLGAASSLVAAAAGGRILALGGEDVPPKAGRTNFDALKNLGVKAPQTLEEARISLEEYGLATTTPEYYLPELYSLLQLRREMVRRTALNVSEKLVSPILGSRIMVGITHRHPFLSTVPEALVDLGVDRALVFQAIEGSDEAPLDGNSALAWVKNGRIEEFRILPESLGLSRATKANVPWKGPEDEARHLLFALRGEEGAVSNLIIYNAALRLWVADEDTPLEDHVNKARETLLFGSALELLKQLRRPSQLCGQAFNAGPLYLPTEPARY